MGIQGNRATLASDSRYTFITASTGTTVLFCGRVIAEVETAREAVNEAIMHADDRLAPRTRGVMQASRISSARISQGVQHG